MPKSKPSEVEIVAMAMHDATWRTETTEIPSWERSSDRVKEHWIHKATTFLRALRGKP